MVKEKTKRGMHGKLSYQPVHGARVSRYLSRPCVLGSLGGSGIHATRLARPANVFFGRSISSFQVPGGSFQAHNVSWKLVWLFHELLSTSCSPYQLDVLVDHPRFRGLCRATEGHPKIAIHAIPFN